MPRRGHLATLGLAGLTVVAACGIGPEARDELVETLSLEGIGYPVGLESAPVTVVEFSDFGCPYCAYFASETYPTLHTEYVMGGRVRWIFVPFVLGMFPNGDAAALAAECAGEQDRFWQMHDLLFRHQGEWRRGGSAGDVFQRLATAARLDPATFAQCLESEAPAARLRRQNLIGRNLGIRGTPSFLIGNRMVQGAIPIGQFRTVLDAEVASAGQ